MSLKYNVEFAKLQFAKFGNILVADFYKDVKTPMPYICVGCGEFQAIGMSLESAMKGGSCAKCGIKKRVSSFNAKRRKYPYCKQMLTATQIIKLSGSKITLKKFFCRVNRDGLSVEEALFDFNYTEKLIEIDGEKVNLKKAAEMKGMPPTRLYSRIRLCGMSPEEALDNVPHMRLGLYKIYENEPAQKLDDWWKDKRRGVKNQSTFCARLRRDMKPQEAFEIADDMDCVYLEIENVRKPLRQWAIESGVKEATFWHRHNQSILQRKKIYNVIRQCNECETIIDYYLKRGMCNNCYKKFLRSRNDMCL